MGPCTVPPPDTLGLLWLCPPGPQMRDLGGPGSQLSLGGIGMLNLPPSPQCQGDASRAGGKIMEPAFFGGVGWGLAVPPTGVGVGFMGSPTRPPLLNPNVP